MRDWRFGMMAQPKISDRPENLYPIRAKMDSGESAAAPAYAVAKIKGTVSSDGLTQPTLEMPDAPGLPPASVVILPGHAVPDEEFISVAMLPIAPLPVAVELESSESDPVAGDVIGPMEDSWYMGPSGFGFRVIWFDATNDIAYVVVDSSTYPPLYKTTAAPGGGEVTAKRVDSSGSTVGSDETFKVL